MDKFQTFYVIQQTPKLQNQTLFSVGLVVICLLLLILLWLPDLLKGE